MRNRRRREWDRAVAAAASFAAVWRLQYSRFRGAGLLAVAEEALHEFRVQVAGAEFRIGKDPPVQWNRRMDPFDDKHFQRSRHTRDRFASIFPAHHQL